MKNDTEQPARMGFDEWSVFGWHEGARFHEPYIYQDGRLRTDTKGKYGPDLYVDFLSEFMENSKKAKKPFFAYYSMALAHDVTDDIPKQVPYVPVCGPLESPRSPSIIPATAVSQPILTLHYRWITGRSRQLDLRI